MIKDLLPLYVENMLSKDSQLLVESHLKTCPECQKELELLKSNYNSNRNKYCTPASCAKKDSKE
jgi:anti-sigma factor RsiW